MKEENNRLFHGLVPFIMAFGLNDQRFEVENRKTKTVRRRSRKRFHFKTLNSNALQLYRVSIPKAGLETRPF